jgi:hypothetical protein
MVSNRLKRQRCDDTPRPKLLLSGTPSSCYLSTNTREQIEALAATGPPKVSGMEPAFCLSSQDVPHAVLVECGVESGDVRLGLLPVPAARWLETASHSGSEQSGQLQNSTII